jgi:cell division cycle 20-like protein 1 (cofactor of APC complex)
MDFYNNLIEKDVEEPVALRQFPRAAYKVLNAPRLKDDFYTTLLDWSKDDMIGVVLDNAVYTWSSKGNDAEKLIEGYISSIKWGKGLIVGEETGRIRVIDVEKRKETVRSKNHLGRVGVLDVSLTGNEIASGSKDSEMIIWDIRQRDSCLRFAGHKQEICGLKWSWDNSMLASGGNDNMVMIWESRMGKNIGKLSDHTAAVKALAWSPHKSSLLATGGGSTDKSIKLWNTVDMNCQLSCDSGSQVCNMLFSSSTN